MSQEERDIKMEIVLSGRDLVVNAEGTESDPYPLVEGANTGYAPTSGSEKFCYFAYTATKAGTVTISVDGIDWRAYIAVYGADDSTIEDGSTLYNPKYDGSTITRELEVGQKFVLKISPYISWSYGGEITVNFTYVNADGSTPGNPNPDPTPEPEDPENPQEPGANVLVLGTNELVSGIRYTYEVTAEGRLEFDFVMKDGNGKTIYQYAYSKADRVKIMVNDGYVANLADTKISVQVGDVITVELVSVDGGEYTATLTMTALEPASKLAIGDNAIAKDTDYSFIATEDGTLYITVKELWCDYTYCSEASLSSSVVFKINGKTISQFENSYEVMAGDEITVLLNTSFGDPASAVLNLSYEGFYKHPAGSRGNPYIVDYTQMPTSTIEIPAGTAVWYKFTGFPSGGQITITGANVYVIINGTRYDGNSAGLMLPAVTNLQIGNSGTTDAAFQLSASVEEGYPANPKDLVEGDNTVELDKSANYYYDFVAPVDGTATFTVSGDNWRFWYSLLAADGSAIVDNQDHQAKRGDEATITVEMTAGQSILLKLGTLNASWSAPGGEITVTFQFEGKVVVEPENPLTLGKNNLESGVTYTYIVPADGRMEFTIGSVYNSAGSKQYSWYNGSKVQILINGKAMTGSTAKFNVTAGQVITVLVNSLDGDTYTTDITLKEQTPAETLLIGDNNLSQDLEYVYVAEQDGTVYVSVIEMLYNGKNVTADVLGSSVQMTINGASVSAFEKSYEVKAGDEIAIIIKDYSWDGSGTVSAVINLSYEGFYEHPVGSLNNPVDLLYTDCPTETIEIAAGSAAWYRLESYYDSSARSTVYPFDGKYLVITGEHVYVIIEGTRYDAVDGVVKILMDDEEMIQIGNDGATAAIFQIAVEIPEGHVDNPQDLVEGDNTVELPSYGSHYFDFIATEDGIVTIVVSGENWKYNFAHYDANGNKLSAKDYYYKNGDADTQTLEIKAGEKIIVTIGTSKGYSQPGGKITVNFHFESTAVECPHSNTEIRGAKDATCTKEGYTGDTYCTDCGELIAEGERIEMLDHNYQDGACVDCGQEDPNAPKKEIVTVEVLVDVDTTNGVINISWDASNMKLVDMVVHADYFSVLEGDGNITVGYVSLNGIAAGSTVITLTFEVIDTAAANVVVEYQQINNDNGEEEEILLGDANGDGEINYFDAILVLQYYTEEEAEGIDLTAADINGDGEVNYQDAILILQLYVDSEA